MSEKLVLTYVDAKEFYYIVQSIAVLLEEGVFLVTPEGLKLRALDPSRTAMIDLFIPREAWEEYPDNVPEDVRVGVNFKDLKKLLQRIKKGDKISLEVLPSESRLRVKLIGKAARSVAIPIIELPYEDVPTPKVAFTVRVKTISDVLYEASKDADAIADSMSFSANDEALVMTAQSDKGKLEVRLERSDERVYEFDVQEGASASYSLEYLVDIASKAYRISDLVTIEFATNKPLALTYEIAGGGRMTYYVAPRIE